MDINSAQVKIIEKIKKTEEEWLLRSILKLLDIEDHQEEEQWYQGASSSLSRAYGDEEPEYEDMKVKEPNPEYRKH